MIFNQNDKLYLLVKLKKIFNLCFFPSHEKSFSGGWTPLSYPVCFRLDLRLNYSDFVDRKKRQFFN